MTILFLLCFAVSCYAMFRLFQDSAGARHSDLGAMFGCFWWTVILGVWTLFGIFSYFKH